MPRSCSAARPASRAAALLAGAGLVVLDGSKSACDWQRDPASPVPGLIPIGRMPTAVRTDWVHNSNDSFVYTNPQQKWSGISPLVGDARVARPRTRAGLMRDPGAAGAAARSRPRRCSGSCSATATSWPAWCCPTCWPPATASRAGRRGTRRLRRAARLGPHQRPRGARRPPVPRVLAHRTADPRCVPRPVRRGAAGGHAGRA